MEDKKKKLLKPTVKPTVKEKEEIIFEEKEQKADSISPEQHAKMLTLIEDLSSKVNRLEAQKVGIAIDEEELLLDDFLEYPITFFSYSLSFGIYGDKRRGKIQETPTGQGVKFLPYYRYNVKNAGKRGTETVSVCRATVHSKKMAEWLRGHSQFGIKFFENIKSAIDQDAFLAEKMVAVSNMISNLGDMKVIERAKNEGINISDPDISNIRQQLIKSIATKQISSERGAREAVAKRLGMTEDKKIGVQAEKGDVTDVY